MPVRIDSGSQQSAEWRVDEHDFVLQPNAVAKVVAGPFRSRVSGAARGVGSGASTARADTFAVRQRSTRVSSRVPCGGSMPATHGQHGHRTQAIDSTDAPHIPAKSIAIVINVRLGMILTDLARKFGFAGL